MSESQYSSGVKYSLEWYKQRLMETKNDDFNQNPELTDEPQEKASKTILLSD